jgi:hypothetical protein
VDDYVVKLRGGLDRGETGLLCELVASGLASHFGIAVPEPALVSLDVDFAELVAAAEPQHADRLRNSTGLNFGSRQLSDVSGWPVDKWIPEAMWQAAVNIFAFDVLIQNPDRRYGNQNYSHAATTSSSTITSWRFPFWRRSCRPGCRGGSKVSRS